MAVFLPKGQNWVVTDCLAVIVLNIYRMAFYRKKMASPYPTWYEDLFFDLNMTEFQNLFFSFAQIHIGENKRNFENTRRSLSLHQELRNRTTIHITLLTLRFNVSHAAEETGHWYCTWAMISKFPPRKHDTEHLSQWPGSTNTAHLLSTFSSC